MTLVEVRADHVLLKRRGVYETLYFPKPQSKGVTFVAPSANATPVAESVATYTELFRQHPERVFDYVRIEPVTSGGELQGYRLVAPEHPELHEQFGILPSDVIVAINGLKLNNQDAVTQALGQLASSNRIELSLIRSGQSKMLSFQLD